MLSVDTPRFSKAAEHDTGTKTTGRVIYLEQMLADPTEDKCIQPLLL